MLERLDEIFVHLHAKRADRSLPASADVGEAVELHGAATVMSDVRRAAETTDRRLGATLAASGFITAFSGHTFGLDVDQGVVQSTLASLATAAALLSFLFSLRGTSRRVDPPLVIRPVDAVLVSRSLSPLAAKYAYSWLASRCVLVAVVCVALAAWLNASF